MKPNLNERIFKNEKFQDILNSIPYFENPEDRIAYIEEHGIDEEKRKQLEDIIEKLYLLFWNQTKFQIKAMGQDSWWEVKELNGKPVNYTTAIFAELGEALGSISFEWWAEKNNDNRENAILELIDILHFELSKTMVSLYNCKDNNCSAEVVDDLIPLFDVILAKGVQGVENDKVEFQQKDLYEILDIYTLKSILAKYRLDPDNKVTLDNQDIHESLKAFADPIIILMTAFKWFGVSFDEVYTRYLVKNALNTVRKMNGYKEGTYEKYWVSLKTGHVVEDNVIAIEECLGKDLSLEDMIKFLDNFYKENVAN